MVLQVAMVSEILIPTFHSPNDESHILVCDLFYGTGTDGSPGGSGFPGIPGGRGIQGAPGARGPPGDAGDGGINSDGYKGDRGVPGGAGPLGFPGYGGYSNITVACCILLVPTGNTEGAN